MRNPAIAVIFEKFILFRKISISLPIFLINPYCLRAFIIEIPPFTQPFIFDILDILNSILKIIIIMM
ncbi:hypothetical protein ALO_15897 [Acetonema longum DSM 6540]|uniref:Uncharacterized protein n=1 Tax=Acetonema longum DSM 6540 TaxID=1009370 RepID=F7NM52_9FIRM|nr:hypothetical protein ALO_15897 [Acetonema longum DSM 6540]